MTHKSFNSTKNKIRENFNTSKINANEIINQDRINVTIDGKITSIQPVVNNFKRFFTVETNWQNMEITSFEGAILLLRKRWEVTFNKFNINLIHTLNPEILNRVGSGSISGDNLNFKIQQSVFHNKQIIYDIKNQVGDIADVTVVASLYIAKPNAILNMPPYQAKLMIQILNPNNFV